MIVTRAGLKRRLLLSKDIQTLITRDGTLYQALAEINGLGSVSPQ